MVWPWITVVLVLTVALVAAGIGLLRWLLLRKARPAIGLLGSVWRSIAEAVASNPDVRRLVDNHPRLFAFLSRRLDRERFDGLPATLLSLAFLYVLVQFLGVVQDLLASDPIVAADIRVANLLAARRTPALTNFFLWVTLLGKWQTVVIFAAAASAVAAARRSFGTVLGIWTCIAGGSAVAWLGKVAFHRQRPAVAEYLEWSFSFPSGHSLMAVALYGFMAYLVWKMSGDWRLRVAATAGALAVMLAVGFSRLYLGVHYLSDVWGGYLLGLLWLIVGVSLSEAAGSRWPGRGAAEPQSRISDLLPWAAAAVALSGYAYLGLNYNPPERIQPAPSQKVVSGDLVGLFAEQGLPRFTETIAGTPQEPLSFIVAAADEASFVECFGRAGWTLAAPESLRSLVEAGRAAVLDRPDATAPMTPSFWDGRPHEFGFQKPLGRASIRERHHARFWGTAFRTPEGLLVWVGTASLDVGLKWGVAHRIQANIDAEREFLLADLARAGAVEGYVKRDLAGPTIGKNFAGDPFFSDGRAYVVYLKKG